MYLFAVLRDVCAWLKVEFRRLTEQVRDVSNDLKNKLRKSPVEQKLYRLTPAALPNPGIQKLHDELQASRLPFQTRQWRHLDVPEQTLVRCRPVSARPKTAHVHSTTTTNCAPQRPCSVPLNGSPHSDNPLEGRLPRPPSSPRPDTPFVTPGNHDTLTPRVLSQLLVDDFRPSSAAYGDRVITRAERKCSARGDKQRGSDDASTTSGVESDSGEAQGNDSDIDKKDDDDDEGDSSDSDAEGFEPSLDDARRQIPSAQNIFQLRPEKLDAIYIPQDKRDMRRFDFDAGNVELPPYEFKSPVPDSLENVNLRLCAKDGVSWREQVSPGLVASLPQNVVGMVNRLVELEKYQLVTQEWEARKLRQQNKRQLSSSGGGQNRATSARVRDKRCCGLCLQAACVGDCPEKHLNVSGGGRCDRCFQLLCPGSCQDTKYEQRMRLTRSGSGILDLSDNPPPLPPRPVSLGCHSCQQRHNAKLINANNILLGRPKSSNSTYSRGKASASPHDLRPLSAASLNASLLKDFERMGIEPQQVATIAKRPPSRLRSRNGLVPGKSLRSNRRESLTEASHNRKRKFVFRRPRTARPNS
ncbi:hypothetical protein C0Q70_18686 [Pomacea canaliculata]|uniref:Uncharacterized protein n=1 Tax=Pomacea canaliculata TaxID=400727 RepID=A0A2T7NH83_POMCA|nr:hypothetical protein C0Q70_18686 [Pomacea canaliculata]